MLLTRRGLFACAIVLPTAARAQGAPAKPDEWRILEARKTSLRLLPEPAPWTNVTELGSSSVTVTLRAWANLDEYWDTRFDLLKAVRLNLDARGLRHAYPAQLTVTAETSPPGAD